MGNVQLSKPAGRALSACSEVLRKDSWISPKHGSGSSEAELLLENMSYQLGRKHELMVLDAMYATDGAASVKYADSSCCYIVASGDRQACTVIDTDGNATTLPSRHMRLIADGDVILCKNKKPTLIVMARTI